MIHYWKIVLTRAFFESWSSVTGLDTWYKIPIALLTVLFVAVLYWRIWGRASMLREYVYPFAIAFAGYAFVFTLVFSAQTLYTPFLMHEALEKERTVAQTRFASLNDEFTKHKVQSQKDIGQRDTEIAKLKASAHSILSGHVTSNKDNDAETARLRDLLDQQKNHRLIREALGQYLIAGIALRERCASDPSESSLEADAQKWFDSVRSYLKEKLDRSYDDRFVAGLMMPLKPNGVSEKRMPVWHGIHQRTEILKKFIEELSD